MLSHRFVTRACALLVFASLPAVARAQMSSVAWRTNLDQAKLEAAQSNRMLLLHFTTARCGPCRLLDKTVFSQPQVGPAIEQNFVPVRIDADASPALAQMYRIRNVPTEIIATPEGQVLADPPIPDKADPYLAQLQNIARHFRQTAAAGPAAPAANVNAAYAALPVSQTSPANSAGPMTVAGGPAVAGGPQIIDNPAVRATAPPQPQTQTNPFVAAAAGVHGQAQSVYAGAVPPAASQSAVGTTAATPAMPENAMPRSYKTPETTAALAAAGPTTAASLAAATPASTPAAAVPAAATAALAAGASAASATPTAAGPAAANSPPTPAVSPVSAALAGAATAARPAPELPAGSPPLAFDGYCPVTLKTLNRWAAGDRQFGAIHRGRTYLFAGAEQRDQFLANPDGFSPVFAGLDPVLLIDKQQSVEGSRAMGYRYGESFYLFSCEESKQKFAASPHRYAAGVRQAMSRIEAADTVRR